jgi:hypothetical protein
MILRQIIYIPPFRVFDFQVINFWIYFVHLGNKAEYCIGFVVRVMSKLPDILRCDIQSQFLLYFPLNRLLFSFIFFASSSRKRPHWTTVRLANQEQFIAT